jgi:trimeric autotransporter adhesin
MDAMKKFTIHNFLTACSNTKLALALFAFFIFFHFSVISQNNVGIGTLTPAPSALLDLQAADKGLLIPRTDTTVINALGTPATGLLIYQTSSNTFYYFDGTYWRTLATSSGGTSNAWDLTGNAGTNPSANFIGTTDNKDVVFKVYAVDEFIIPCRVFENKESCYE